MSDDQSKIAKTTTIPIDGIVKNIKMLRFLFRQHLIKLLRVAISTSAAHTHAHVN
jgi:hypothetical protein